MSNNHFLSATYTIVKSVPFQVGHSKIMGRTRRVSGDHESELTLSARLQFIAVILFPQETVRVQCCFTSTETIRLIRDGKPRTATSTFTDTAPMRLDSGLELVI